MTISFRNVDVDVDASVETWPFEAIVTTIERGTIGDWSILSRAIRTDPWGPVARQVEEYLAYEQPYGVAPLLTRAIAQSRAAAEDEERREVANEVAGLVSQSGLSLADFASRIGTSASRLSTYRSGRVIPSAALLVRMRSVASRLG